MSEGGAGGGEEREGRGGEGPPSLQARPALCPLGLTSSGGFFTFCMYLRTTSSGFLPARAQGVGLEGMKGLLLRAWLRTGSGVREVGLAGVKCQG